MTRRIDWDAEDWGGGITYAANGSWVMDGTHDDGPVD